MFANLLGQKAVRHLSDADMAHIIGVSRNTYMTKVRTGKFTPEECKTLCEYFNKPFDYLFAEDGEFYNP